MGAAVLSPPADSRGTGKERPGAAPAPNVRLPILPILPRPSVPICLPPLHMVVWPASGKPSDTSSAADIDRMHNSLPRPNLRAKKILEKILTPTRGAV